LGEGKDWERTKNEKNDEGKQMEGEMGNYESGCSLLGMM
jgi:hypothetical protein